MKTQSKTLYKSTLAVVMGSLLTACGGSDTIDNATSQPDPEPTVMTTMTIEGQVVDNEVANANVSLSLDGETFTAEADGSGNYLLEVEFEEGTLDTAVMISINAQGVGDQAHIELVSTLGTFEALQQAAGDDDALVAEELDKTNVTHITTASHLLVKDSNNGVIPSTDEALKTFEDNIAPQSLLDIASSIKVFADNPDFTPAEGFTTLSIVDNPQSDNASEALQSYMDSQGLTDGDGNPNEAFQQAKEQALEATVNNDVTKSSLSEEQLAGKTHILLPQHHNDFLPWTATTLRLNEDGTGIYGDERTNDNIIMDIAINWQLEDGQLVVSYPESMAAAAYWPISHEKLADVFGQTIAEQLVQWHENGSLDAQVEVITTPLSSEFSLVLENSTGGVISGKDTHQYKLNLPEQLASQIADPEQLTVQTSELTGATRWLHQLDSTLDSLGSVSGEWALPLPATVDTDAVDHEINDYNHFMVELQDGGSARYWLQTGSVITSPNADSLSWSEGDSSFTIDGVDGASYRYTPFMSIENQNLALVEKVVDDIVQSAFTRQIIKVDNADLNGANLVTQGPEFYQSHVNSNMDSRWEGDKIAFEYLFGYQFNADGTLQRLWSAYDYSGAEPTPVINNIGGWNWFADEARMILNSDPSVDPIRFREWVLLNESESGKLTILEWEERQSVGEFDVHIMPRINILAKASTEDWLGDGDDDTTDCAAERIYDLSGKDIIASDSEAVNHYAITGTLSVNGEQCQLEAEEGYSGSCTIDNNSIAVTIDGTQDAMIGTITPQEVLLVNKAEYNDSDGEYVAAYLSGESGSSCDAPEVTAGTFDISGTEGAFADDGSGGEVYEVTGTVSVDEQGCSVESSEGNWSCAVDGNAFSGQGDASILEGLITPTSLTYILPPTSDGEETVFGQYQATIQE